MTGKQQPIFLVSIDGIFVSDNRFEAPQYHQHIRTWVQIVVFFSKILSASRRSLLLYQYRARAAYLTIFKLLADNKLKTKGETMVAASYNEDINSQRR